MIFFTFPCRCLTNQDAVTFYDKLNNLRTVEYAMKSSGWMMLDIVDDVFKHARSRIYNEKNGTIRSNNFSIQNYTTLLHKII